MNETEKNNLKQKLLKRKIHRLELDKMIDDVQSRLKKLREQRNGRLKHLEDT